MTEKPIEKEKVIRCRWSSVMYHARRRAPKGYEARVAFNLERDKIRTGNEVVRASIVYVLVSRPDYVVRRNA